MSERLGAEHYGAARAETDLAKAERIIAGELKRRKWKAAEFQARPKGDAEKVVVAARLRAETTMTAGTGGRRGARTGLAAGVCGSTVFGVRSM